MGLSVEDGVMIDNNYVPEWYISPFEHSKYALVRNQDQFDIMFDDVTDTEKFMSAGADAQVDYYSDGKYCLVQIGDTSDKSLIQVHGLLLHEAVHVWQKIRKLMGECEPSIEFEAYSVQRIAMDLFDAYEQSEVNDGLERKETN